MDKKLTKAQQTLLDQLKAGYRIQDTLFGYNLQDETGKLVRKLPEKMFWALFRDYLTRQGKHYVYREPDNMDTFAPPHPAAGIDTPAAVNAPAETVASVHATIPTSIEQRRGYLHAAEHEVERLTWEAAQGRNGWRHSMPYEMTDSDLVLENALQTYKETLLDLHALQAQVRRAQDELAALKAENARLRAEVYTYHKLLHDVDQCAPATLSTDYINIHLIEAIQAVRDELEEDR